MELPPGRRCFRLIQKIAYLFLLMVFIIGMGSLLAIENINTEEFRHEYTQTFSRLKIIKNFQETQTFISSNTKTDFVKPLICCVCFSFLGKFLLVINRLIFIPVGINAPPI